MPAGPYSGVSVYVLTSLPAHPSQISAFVVWDAALGHKPIIPHH